MATNDKTTATIRDPAVRCYRCDKPLPMVIGVPYNGEGTKDGQLVFYCHDCWPVRYEPTSGDQP